MTDHVYMRSDGWYLRRSVRFLWKPWRLIEEPYWAFGWGWFYVTNLNIPLTQRMMTALGARRNP